jgi:hypothetical protein
VEVRRLIYTMLRLQLASHTRSWAALVLVQVVVVVGE